MSETERRMALVATRHYLEGRSRVEIAEEIGISRFAVARLLEQARERGIVRFQITSPDDLDLDLSSRMRAEFGLHHALVVHVPPTNDRVLRQRLGRTAARLLEEIVSPDDVIGISGGRTLHEMVQELEALPRADVVQLAGVTESTHESGVEFVRRMARISGGFSHILLAPLLTQSDDSARLIRAEPSLSETFSRFGDVSVAVVGIGSWVGPTSPMRDLAERLGLLADLQRAGVAADIGSVLITSSGDEVIECSTRRIAISGDELRVIPEVVAVAGGREKRAAIRAALRSGMIDSLVCDVDTAEAMLASSPGLTRASGHDPSRAKE